MSKKSRKIYEKPQINQVKLVIDEAVLQSCKVKVNLASVDKHCNHVNCKTSGS